jgi:hypothetical protein
MILIGLLNYQNTSFLSEISEVSYIVLKERAFCLHLK